MCGITFLYNKQAEQSELLHLINSSLNTLFHRGPDDGGTWSDENVAIGHRRLAILDLAASQQPMRDPTGRYVLTFNGEIYNYKELRRGLEAEWRFLTQGDTETLLAGMILKGEKFVHKMEGMWAFALWDNEEQTLFLSRDRIGKKPLYYQSNNKSFACASELPALAKLSPKSPTEDLNSTADYFRYGYYLPGTTAYTEIAEVLPGHYLTWKPGNPVRQTPYWQLSIGGFQGSHELATEQLRETLIEATRKRLVADVEVGAFLSGGVDSSLIVAILAGKLDVHPKTFSIGFQEKSFDERPYARLIAKQYATEHFEDCLDCWNPDILTHLIKQHIGQPFFDASLLPTALVSSLAARHVKVSLSGDGGDELFSGYQRYQARAILRWYTRLPRGLQKLAETAVRALPEPMAHHSRSIIKKAHLFLDIVARQRAETPYIAPVLYSDQEFSRLAPDLINKGHQPPGLPEESTHDSILEMMAADSLVYLPQDILQKVDRASMAYSLETRAPFLDHKLIDLAFSLPRTYHRRGLSGKRMIKSAFYELLPSSIWSRRKQGFGVPIHTWFRGPLGNTFQQLLEENLDLPIDRSEAFKLLEDHRSNLRDHGYRLWNIYVYLLWRNQHRWQS